MKKKILSMALIIVMLLSTMFVLAGCGEESNNKSDNLNDNINQNAVETVTDDSIENNSNNNFDANSDKGLPEFVTDGDWKTSYMDFVYDNFAKLSGYEYALSDIDENGVPELLIFTGMDKSNAEQIVKIYTYDNHKTIFLGEVNALNKIVYKGEKGSLYIGYFHADNCNITKVTITNAKSINEEVTESYSRVEMPKFESLKKYEYIEFYGINKKDVIGTYKSNEEKSTNINANKDAENQKSSEIESTKEVKLSDVVQIGDSVAYDSKIKNNKTYTTNSSLTGEENYSGTTFSSNDYNGGWRVLNIDKEKGTVTLVADKVLNRVSFNGMKGYENGEKILNSIGELYGNGRGATSGRSIKLSDIEKLSENDQKKLFSGDGFYLATCTYTQNNFYSIKYFSQGGIFVQTLYEKALKSSYPHGLSFGVRPVVVLKENIKTSGKNKDGTYMLITE